MRALAVSLLLASSSTALAAPTPIIGGTQTTVDQFPTVVLLQVGGGLCTGTLVHKDWVLTAAHCISPQVLGMNQQQITSSLKVHFGTVNVSRSQGTVVTASATYPHPEFRLQALGSHDIGLIKLATPVTDITPVPVNLETNKSPVGLQVTMVGYGATLVGVRGSFGIQHTVEQTVVSCAGSGGSNENLLCFNQSGGKGKCQGDSGGPSFAMVDGKQMQVGVTSFGDEECAQFGADTRPDAETDFLAQYVDLSKSCESDTDCESGQTCFDTQCILTPFTDGGLGAGCENNADCESGACASAGEDSRCTQGCTMGEEGACPSGLECITSGDSGACWPTEDDGGCSTADASSSAPWLLVGVGLVGFAVRRRGAR